MPFSSLSVHAGIVFEQPHDGTGVLKMSSRYQPNGSDYDQFVWDSFSVPTAQAVTEIRWRGGYVGNNQAANPVGEFIIKIYGSTANGFYPDLANPVLKKYTITGNASESVAGLAGGVQMYDYSVTLPTLFVATAGTGYWIQIEASQYGYPLTWGHATGAGGDNAHYRRMGASYYSGSGDLALTLSADVPTSYAIGATPSSVNGGSVSGAGTFALDAVVKLSASARTGYAFVNWTEGGEVVGSSALHTFSATADRTLVANFQPTYQVALTSSSLTMGTVAGANSYLIGTGVTATATAKPGYVFLNWSEAGNIVSTAPAYTFTLLNPRTLLANFAAGFTVTTTPSFAPGGSVSGGGGYATGGTATLIATPTAGYQFTGWTEGGTVVSSSSSYSFAIAANRSLTANFLPIVGIASSPSSPSGALGIAWPASATGWVLQESPDLSPSSWVNSALPVTTSGGQNQVSITIPTVRLFFRLAHP